MNDYQLRQREQNQRLTAEILAICEHMPGNWTIEQPRTDEADENYKTPRIMRDDTGKAIYFHVLWNDKDRIEFSPADYPEYMDRGGKVTKVTCRDLWSPSETEPRTKANRNRPAQAIAKQLQTKILKPWEPIRARLQEKADSNQAYNDRKNTALENLAKACGIELRPDQTTLYAHIGADHKRIEFRSDTSVILDVTAAEAVQIIELLRSKTLEG